MTHHDDPAGASVFDRASDDALLLSEFCHRTANEIAAAAAALHIAKRAANGASARLLDRAVDRLEAFGELHRVLARPVPARTDVSRELALVCRAIASGASGATRSVVSIDVPETLIDGGTARRLVLVAAELVTNAVRHALVGRAGSLHVSLELAGDDVVLCVTDDGRGMMTGAATAGTGLGGGIVAQLVDRAGGTVSIESGPGGTAVRVALPVPSALGGEADIVF